MSFVFDGNDVNELKRLASLGIRPDNSTIGIAIIDGKKVPGVFVFDGNIVKSFYKMHPFVNTNRVPSIIDFYFSEEPTNIDDVDCICEPFSWPDFDALIKETLKQI